MTRVSSVENGLGLLPSPLGDNILRNKFYTRIGRGGGGEVSEITVPGGTEVLSDVP